MRLLHTKTLELKEFFGKDVPSYAILSHTWEDGQEVTFQDFLNPTEEVKERTGYTKIVRACQLSYRYGFQYIWIDTCCINKESSAELSEAINSMYQYYRSSVVCYAYMEDVCSDEDPRKDGSRFSKSKWFNRGWTLQELLAPSRLVFFDRDWTDIGTKASLEDIIIAETGIPSSVLHSLSNLDSTSIAQRMAWAAKRETTREEDLAYCLMGIFGVNMPTLYGEGGTRAFLRLQEEIIKRSADQSIFAWRAQDDGGSKRGLLARSPSEFVSSGRVRASSGRDITTFALGNHGLCIKVPLIPLDDQLSVFLEGQLENRDLCFAIFDCQLEGRDDTQALGIYLERENAYNQFVRVKPDRVVLGHRWSKVSYLKQEIYVKEPDVSHITPKPKKSSWTFVTTSGNIAHVPRPEKLCSSESSVSTTGMYTIVETHPKLTSISWMTPSETQEDVYKHSRKCMVSGITLVEQEVGMLKIQNTQNKETFVVVFGSIERIWAEILTEQEWQTYNVRVSRAVDRVGRALKDTEHSSVSVALKKYHNNHQYLVEIDIREKMRVPYITARLPPPLEYGYAVSIRQSTDFPCRFGISTFPDDIWTKGIFQRSETPSATVNLFLPVPSSEVPGIILFHRIIEGNANQIPLFAVVLGIEEFQGRAEIVTAETLESEAIEGGLKAHCEMRWRSRRTAKEPSTPISPASLSASWDAREVNISIRENPELDQFVTHRAVIIISRSH